MTIANSEPSCNALQEAIQRRTVEVARRLGNSTPVLFLTGLPPDDEAIDGPGVRGSIEKPFSPDALLQRIEAALESAA